MPKARVLPALLSLAFALAGSVALVAQRTPTPADQDQSIDTLKVRVNVVQLFFNVKDKKGALIPDRTKDDFEVLHDKDEAFIDFDVNVDLLQDFTNDVHRLKAALNKAKVNTGGGGGSLPG